MRRLMMECRSELMECRSELVFACCVSLSFSVTQRSCGAAAAVAAAARHHVPPGSPPAKPDAARCVPMPSSPAHGSRCHGRHGRQHRHQCPPHHRTGTRARHRRCHHRCPATALLVARPLVCPAAGIETGLAAGGVTPLCVVRLPLAGPGRPLRAMSSSDSAANWKALAPRGGLEPEDR